MWSGECAPHILLKLICGSAGFSVLPCNFFDLKVEGSFKNQEASSRSSKISSVLQNGVDVKQTMDLLKFELKEGFLIASTQLGVGMLLLGSH